MGGAEWWSEARGSQNGLLRSREANAELRTERRKQF